jgi:uncharacterized repeat protein (TIGR03803 family)
MLTIRTLAIAGLAFVGLLPAFGAHAQRLKTLYRFAGGSDGADPNGELLFLNGALYGTTVEGGGAGCGSSGCGTVFALNPNTGSEKVLHRFAGGTDGQNPMGHLAYANGLLYGATADYAANAGTVFSVDPVTGAEIVLYTFTGGADGGNPYGGVIFQAGGLYGTTWDGGPPHCPDFNGCGVVFRVDASTGAEIVVHSFNGGTGQGTSFASLIYHGGSLFGTTLYGGRAGVGKVFKINLHTSNEQPLYSFAGGSDGAIPFAGVIFHGGALFGTTSAGGAQGAGTVLKLDPVSRNETVLHAFGGSDGAVPASGLIYDGGLLYGTTGGGGAYGYGTVFKLDPSTGRERIVHSFSDGADGSGPSAALIRHGRYFYGTTSAGGGVQRCGAGGCGTVFRIKP